MRKLLFVTARLPYPPVSGRKNVMYHYCRILHETFGYEIVIASFLEHDDSVEPKPDFIKDVYPLPEIPRRTKLSNILRNTLLGGRYPMQVSLFWSKAAKLRIDEIIENFQPDIAMADMVRTTEYLWDYHGYKIANLDDMLSVRYQRQLKMNLKQVNPYGAYLYLLPEGLQKLLGIGWLKRWILSKEIRLLNRYEQKVGKMFDKTVFVAQKEADALNQAIHADRAQAIPMGVDIEYFGRTFEKRGVQHNTIAFLGAMNVAHNESGIIHFVQDIFPLVLERIPNAVLYIVGGGVTAGVQALAGPNVIVTGRVEDVREHVAACRVFVCPLQFGSGIKTKNLEAMAMGVPVVTTSVGAENIDAHNGMDWLVADTVEAFAKAVVSILEDDALYNRLRQNGYIFVRDHFTWKVAQEKMSGIVLTDGTEGNFDHGQTQRQVIQS